MVSTRQMSSVGGGGSEGSSAGAGPSHAEPAAVPRVTRHSSAHLPGGSSPHGGTKCSSLVPAPKTYSTGLLDLPIEVLEKIFSCLGYKSVSQLRMVIFLLSTFLKLNIYELVWVWDFFYIL